MLLWRPSGFGTHIEVELTPQDHAVFRAIRLSLGLSHADSLVLLLVEDGLSRAFGDTPVACRFTTSRRIVSGGGGWEQGQAIVRAPLAG